MHLLLAAVDGLPPLIRNPKTHPNPHPRCTCRWPLWTVHPWASAQPTLTHTLTHTLSPHPQVHLPLVAVDGAPVGLSLLGPHGSDEQLMELAEVVMDAVDEDIDDMEYREEMRD